MGINVYQIVTDRIIAELENGVIPWEKPWTGVRSGAYSRATGRPYSVLNQLLLRKPGEYLTFKQVGEAGGSVRKGEKASIVVFWKPLPVKEKTKDGKEVTKIVPLLKYYHVFHIDQCDGVKPRFTEEDLKPIDPIAEAEAVLADYSARAHVPIIHEKGDRAYYSHARDEIHLPLRDQFVRAAEYYSTAFHESVHSTGHEKRLNRLSKNAHFGSEDYSKEELVAEVGAAILMNEVGIETKGSFRNSAGYIQNWLTALRNDSRMIVSAAGKARHSLKTTIAILAVLALVVGGGLSLLASSNPDGLEWALFGNAEEGYSENMGLDEDDYGISSSAAEKAESIQEATSFLPDYSFADSDSPVGTTVSGIVGAAVVAAVAGVICAAFGFFRKRKA